MPEIFDRLFSSRRRSTRNLETSRLRPTLRANKSIPEKPSISVQEKQDIVRPATSGANGSMTNGVNGAVSEKSLTEAQGKYPEPPDHGKSRVDIEGALTSFVNLVTHSMRPLPTQTGDGSYLEDHDIHPSLFKELSTIGIGDMKALIEKLETKGPVDDKTMLMEHVIQLVATLPDKSIHRFNLTNTFVDQLFTSLQHPPLSYLGDKFRYRQADGSYNNILYPHLGAANTPYARTVIPEMIQSGAQPAPDLVFDSVLAREKFDPHPNRNSSIIFYWASIVIHDLFQTDHHDVNNSQTSSYLDLSPLYGDNQDDQDLIRTFKDGLLKPDCFSEHRLLSFPPGCGTLLIMFNRFHNYVAKQLAAINENRRFNKPSDKLNEERAANAWKKYDNDLFQTARLVTCGLYMNITLNDYVRNIINLNRSNTTWTLDPRVKMKDNLFDKGNTPRGIGNQVSAEFNLVYRWHSAISDRDDKWTQALFRELFGKEASELTEGELLMGLKKWEETMPKDPLERNFNNMKRDPQGNFNDDDLVEIISSSIEDVAGRFGALHTPKALKAITIMGFQQARAWDLASLNEFRKFFGLKAHETFEDINPDKHVAQQLRRLYEHPDRVELYTGLTAEAAKQPMTHEQGGPIGVGISPTYTMSRAVLSDAVALVRGDRFYTIDYHPKNLTNWGFTEVHSDPQVEQGCCFSRLFLRAFPDHFKPNSIYAHQPMTIPSENRLIMKSLDRESHYSWDKPARIPGRIIVQSYKGCKQISGDANTFKVINADAFGYLYGPGGRKFMLSGDGVFFTKQKKMMMQSLYQDEWHQQVKDFYEHITLDLLNRHSVKIAGRTQIDITRDVGNLAHIHFVSKVFSLPLKTEENPRGIYSEQELYLVMAAQFVFLFFDVDPANSWALALAVRPLIQQLGGAVLANVKWISGTSTVRGILDKFTQDNGYLSKYGVHMIMRLLDSGMSAEDITWQQIMGTAGAMVANQAQVFTQIIDFYLTSDEGHKHWPEIQRLAKQNTADADDLILHYAMEAIRLHGTFGGYREVAKAATIDDGGFSGTVHVKPGDKVFMSYIYASRDADVFPDPMAVNPRRDLDTYIHYGSGPHQCLGMKASRVALAAMVKTIAKLENLRPAPGAPGVLLKIDKGSGFYAYMTEDHGKFWPFPTTWKLHFDDPEGVFGD